VVAREVSCRLGGTVARSLRALPLWLLLLLVPLVAGGCITVESDLMATPTPKPTVDPAAASPTAAALVTPSPSPTPRPTPEPVDAEVLGFVPYWQLDAAADSIEPDILTIAAFHSVEASQDGKLVSRKPNGNVPPGWAMLGSDRFKQLKNKLQKAGVKVVPVVQRTAWTEGTRKRMVTLLSKPKNRRSLARTIAGYVSKQGFDGVNLDFEPLPPKVADKYVLFVQEVRAALDRIDPELHLSVDVVPGLENYDLAALTADDAADLAVLMGYSYRTPASGQTGAVAPLDDTAPADLWGTVESALLRAPADRLLLALPWYGVAWSAESEAAGATTLKGKDVVAAGTVDYHDAVAQAARSGRAYESGQASAWSSYVAKGCDDCAATWRQLWYDDPDSFGAKIDLAIDQDLAGVGIWALGMDGDRDELWATLQGRLQPGWDEVPPGGTPALDPDTVKEGSDGRPRVSGSADLLLYAADEPGGSGLGYVRIGLDDALDQDGRLMLGRTYPAVERIRFPLGDASTGGSAEDGLRRIHVQWRDLAGNWSVPLVIEADVTDPEVTATPADR